MQTSKLRYLILTAVLLAGACLHAALGEPLSTGTPRLPAADPLYRVDVWTVSPPEVSGTTTVSTSRVYQSDSGSNATFTMFSNQAPKLYAAGAEVPFLGSGYSVGPAVELMPLESQGVQALLAQRGPEQWLVMYAYGERRGLLGNGAWPWTLALFDSVAGRPNDYYKLYLVARIDDADPVFGRQVVQLAGTLFPRIAGYYAS